MKKMVFLSACLMFAIAAFAEPTVSDVRARQRYPWNGMVDIDYTITGDASGCKLDVIVEDKQSGKRYVPTKFLSTKSVSEGSHRLTWSTEAEGVTIVSTNVSFTLALASKAPEAVTNNLYYVIDLSAGPTATSYPVSTLSTIPGADWTGEYKTTKLVLRRINPGDIPTRPARITKAFYIGVFEITEAQWNCVTAASDDMTNARAKSYVSYDDIRGSNNGSAWPTSSAVDANSFCGILRNKTGLNVDLPTEAQWEYACRAGTTSAYNDGGDTAADLAIVGRYVGNQNDGRGGFAGVTIVGSYLPNNWGLYDMHGNVLEWCLDWCDNNGHMVGDDPVGPTTESIGSSLRERIMRGGSESDNANECTSSYAGWTGANSPSSRYGDGTTGFRIVCPAGL